MKVGRALMQYNRIDLEVRIISYNSEIPADTRYTRTDDVNYWRSNLIVINCCDWGVIVITALSQNQFPASGLGRFPRIYRGAKSWRRHRNGRERLEGGLSPFQSPQKPMYSTLWGMGDLWWLGQSNESSNGYHGIEYIVGGYIVVHG